MHIYKGKTWEHNTAADRNCEQSWWYPWVWYSLKKVQVLSGADKCLSPDLQWLPNSNFVYLNHDFPVIISICHQYLLLKFDRIKSQIIIFYLHSFVYFPSCKAEEPGGLQSIGFQRVGHNWSDWAQHAKKVSSPNIVFTSAYNLCHDFNIGCNWFVTWLNHTTNWRLDLCTHFFFLFLRTT